MDPEPERCRRTDGKKWRCYLPVVPNEKYCEKHMHRGRKRSRKLVETITTDRPNVSGNLFEVQVTHNRKSQPLNETSEAVISAPCLSDIVEKRDGKVEKSNEGEHNMTVKSRIASINLDPGLNSFPKSTCKDDHRCSEAERQVSAPQSVTQKCSRTDGRKWQCHNERLQGQKYCAQQTHRGLKKPAISPSANISSSTPKWAVLKQEETSMDLDTNLSISLPMKLDDPEQNVRDTTTGSSDCSSETTISDDSAYISNPSVVSPGL